MRLKWRADDGRRATPDTGDGLQPLITTSEFVVGQNRFAFGLLQAGKLLEGADVKLRLYAMKVEKPN